MAPVTFLDYATNPPKWERCLLSLPTLTVGQISECPEAARIRSHHRGRSKEKYDALKSKRAWDFALAPAKSFPMNLIMVYMSGGGVQLFSLGMLFMLIFNPVKAISNIQAAFAPYKPTSFTTPGDPLILQKIVYVLCNLLPIGLALYKCRSMGLVPRGTGDWLAFETRGVPPEISLR